MTQITKVDEILENDIISALSNLGNQSITIENKNDNQNDILKVSSNIDNLSNITTLLQQVIAGKTLEISIKVKG
jgi:hypothetical protein